ncbi:MAG TPA: aldo/keto reductase [Anaerolineales bacterium]|nr:aldo/keto reductase [Anaerolineales bacterium]
MIPKKHFGRTGHESTRLIFGGAALWAVTQAEADATLDLLFEHGINHIDTAASYGEAERRIGPWMERYRQQFFLATKTEERTRLQARTSLHRSLELLRTDHIDLFQIHNLSTQDEWEIALGIGGALEAFVEAREEGLVRFIGLTGHGTDIARLHRGALERFDFDSVLLPYNYAMMENQRYAADFIELLKTCELRNIAVQTIKSLTRAPWGDHPQTRNTWYQPLEEQADIDLAVHWVLGEPAVFLNSVADIHLLPRVLDAAELFQFKPSEDEMQALASRVSLEPLFT